MKNKAADFERLSVYRTGLALNAMRLLGNLANRYAYEFTDEQTKEVIDTLRQGIDDLQEKFANPVGPRGVYMKRRSDSDDSPSGLTNDDTNMQESSEEGKPEIKDAVNEFFGSEDQAAEPPKADEATKPVEAEAKPAPKKGKSRAKKTTDTEAAKPAEEPKAESEPETKNEETPRFDEISENDVPEFFRKRA